MTRGKRPSEATPMFWVAICLIFLVLGLYQVFASRHTWLGIGVCAIGFFWLVIGLRYRRR